LKNYGPGRVDIPWEGWVDKIDTGVRKWNKGYACAIGKVSTFFRAETIVGTEACYTKCTDNFYSPLPSKYAYNCCDYQELLNDPGTGICSMG